jgi:hypothetical protein
MFGDLIPRPKRETWEMLLQLAQSPGAAKAGIRPPSPLTMEFAERYMVDRRVIGVRMVHGDEGREVLVAQVPDPAAVELPKSFRGVPVVVWMYLARTGDAKSRVCPAWFRRDKSRTTHDLTDRPPWSGRS